MHFPFSRYIINSELCFRNEVSIDHFNTMMDRKLNEFKSSIISELTKNMKVLIQSEFQNIIQEYKSHLEKVSLTVAMLQPLVIN